MTPGQRFKSWVEGLSEAWKDRLRGWFLRSVSEGLYKFGELLEPGMITAIRANLLKVKANPRIPQEIRDLIDRSLTPGHPALIVIGVIMAIAMIIQTIQTIWIPANKQQSYSEERVAKTYRLDPYSTITAWRRDPSKYAALFDDLRDQGWSEERIEALKFYTQAFPSLRDVVGFYAHEVFEPDMVERYGLRDELPPYAGTLFEKLGVPEEIATDYWIDHWTHASWMQVIEMLHRGQLTEDEVRQWFRVVEIPPYWRDKLIATSWNVPTRVDVRRWWDMRTIDEARLREIYTAQGYHGKDLDDYVLWTKIYVDFPDLMTRYKNGWLTLEEVRAELISLGMSAERAEVLIQTKVKAVASETLVKERDLTLAQIVKGVKKAVISRGEGSSLMQDMGYDPYEAEYILAIEIPQDEVVTEVKVRELTKADILSGLKTGIISEPEAMTRLLGLRYIPSDAEFLLNIYRAQVEPPVEPKLKEASKADIVQGVKKGLITEYEGYIMLLDLGFSPESAEFILMVKAEESPFSPMSYNEFKDLTQKFQVATGKEVKPMSEDLKQAAAEVVRLTDEVKALKESVTLEQRGLVQGKELPPEATKKLRALQVKRNRAIAELERAKSEYNRLVAEWRH